MGIHVHVIWRYISDFVTYITRELTFACNMSIYFRPCHTDSSIMPTWITTRCIRSCLSLAMCLLLLVVATLRFGGPFKDLPTLVTSRLKDVTDSKEVRLKKDTSYQVEHTRLPRLWHDML